MPIGVSIFAAIVFIVIVVFIVLTVRGILQWLKNNNAPKTPVQARVVTKRMFAQAGAATSYFITFEFLSGDRKEFHIRFRDYGLIAEGDNGILTFQGTRFISFERSRP